MSMHRFGWFVVVFAWPGLGATAAEGQKIDGEREAAIQKSAKEYVAAFNKADVAALAEMWTSDGDYVDQTGREIKGKKLIQQAYEKYFQQHQGAKLSVSISSIRFIKDDLTIVDGVNEVSTSPDGLPTSARFTAIEVKQDGRWLLSSIRETVVRPPSNIEHLEPIAWLVGDWEGETAKGASAKISFSWVENQNFLLSSFAMTLNGEPVGGGTQWIGWDASIRRIRSWAFDSAGGFAEGSWSSDGDTFTIKNQITTHTGQKLAATNIIVKVDDDHFTWQSTQRFGDGKELPDTPIIKLKRVKEK